MQNLARSGTASRAAAAASLGRSKAICEFWAHSLGPCPTSLRLGSRHWEKAAYRRCTSEVVHLSTMLVTSQKLAKGKPLLCDSFPSFSASEKSINRDSSYGRQRNHFQCPKDKGGLPVYLHACVHLLLQWITEMIWASQLPLSYIFLWDCSLFSYAFSSLFYILVKTRMNLTWLSSAPCITALVGTSFIPVISCLPEMVSPRGF